MNYLIHYSIVLPVLTDILKTLLDLTYPPPPTITTRRFGPKAPPPPKKLTATELLHALGLAVEAYEDHEEHGLALRQDIAALMEATARARQEVERLENKPQRQGRISAVHKKEPEEYCVPEWQDTDSQEKLQAVLDALYYHSQSQLLRNRLLEDEKSKLANQFGKASKRIANLTHVTVSDEDIRKSTQTVLDRYEDFALAKLNVAVKVPERFDQLEAWSREHLAGKLIILPRALRETKDSGYGHVKTLYHALLLLANEYRDQIIIGDRASYQRFNKRLGELYLRIGKTHSSTSGTLLRDRYTFEYGCRPTFFDMHLKKGNSRDAHHCMRIYFTFDKKTNNVVVGHMPSHLHNALS